MRKSFLLLLLIVALSAGLVLVLPQLPQDDLQKRLTVKFEQILQQPCRIDKVSLQFFPHPAVVVQDLKSATTQLTIKSNTLALEFSYLSLLKFSPEIAGLTLQGTFIKTPLTPIVKPVSDQPANPLAANSDFNSLLNRLGMFSASEQNLHYINIHDGNWELTAVSGLDEPLNITDITGQWRKSARNLSENLKLTGVVAGGRGDLDMTWYKVDKPEADGAEKLLQNVAIDRLEVSGHLDAFSLPVYEMVLTDSPDRSLRAGFSRGFIEFDINGDPQAGLRFTGKLAVDNHKLAIYDTESDSEKICSQGEAKLSLSGFFQRHDSYINIKSAALEFPGAATLFSRGLIRFGEPLLVDLVNELKINDLKLVSSNIPVLGLPGYQVEGQLGGELKLVGNPVSSPVLQIKLKSDRIVLHKDVTADPPARTPQAKFRKELTLKPGRRAGQFLQYVAGWDWLVKGDCQIKSLELPELTITDISLLAEKSLMQLEIERLSAAFGKSGQLRLSLILDDLLQTPRWQASLIARKFNLETVRESFSTTGILDASLVGSGLLDSESGLPVNLDLNGKWRLRQGSLSASPFFTAFSHFVKEKQQIQLGTDFSDFSGKFTLRNQVLRLANLLLHSDAARITAGGRFLTDSKRLRLNGKIVSKSSSPAPVSSPFTVSGDYQHPRFQ